MPKITVLFIAIALVMTSYACTGLEYQPQEIQTAVTFESPDDGATVSNPVVLEARANDFVGGSINPLIEWSSDIDGNLGSGARVETDLSLGEHVITASVDDGQGGMDTESRTITVQ